LNLRRRAVRLSDLFKLSLQAEFVERADGERGKNTNALRQHAERILERQGNLGRGAFGGGWIGMDRFGAFLAPVLGPTMDPSTSPGGKQLDLTLSILAVLAALFGLVIADRIYRRKAAVPPENPASMPAGYRLLANKYYVDEIYSFAIVKPILALSKYFLEWVVDVAILGGLAWLLAGIASLGGAILQRWQSGNLRSYAAWLALGAAVLLAFVLAPYVFGASGIDLRWAGH
jgi:NADH-quinone oxidoreductase subunit L